MGHSENSLSQRTPHDHISDILLITAVNRSAKPIRLRVLIVFQLVGLQRVLWCHQSEPRSHGWLALLVNVARHDRCSFWIFLQLEDMEI